MGDISSILTTTTVTVIAVDTAAQAHPCLICLLRDSRRNSSVLASMLLYNPNCLILESFEETEPSLVMVITSLRQDFYCVLTYVEWNFSYGQDVVFFFNVTSLLFGQCARLLVVYSRVSVDVFSLEMVGVWY